MFHTSIFRTFPSSLAAAAEPEETAAVEEAEDAASEADSEDAALEDAAAELPEADVPEDEEPEELPPHAAMGTTIAVTRARLIRYLIRFFIYLSSLNKIVSVFISESMTLTVQLQPICRTVPPSRRRPETLISSATAAFLFSIVSTSFLADSLPMASASW